MSTKQTASMEKSAVSFEAPSDAWLLNELFEQTRDYLTRGRRFETRRFEQLNEEWANAFRQFVRLDVGPYLRDMADAGAELRLRGAEFPTHLVTAEVEQLQAAIMCLDSVAPSAEFDRRFDESIGDLDEPMN